MEAMEADAVAFRTRARCKDSPEKSTRRCKPCASTKDGSAGRKHHKRTRNFANTNSFTFSGPETSNNRNDYNEADRNDSRSKDGGVGTTSPHSNGPAPRPPAPVPTSSNSDVVIVNEVQADDRDVVLSEPHAKRRCLGGPAARGAAAGARAKGPDVKKSDSDHGDDDLDDDEDLRIVGVVGQVATRDLPHPRPDCAEHRFVPTGAESNCRRCSQCYCYVCDVRASECEFWGTGRRDRDHSNARPNPPWTHLRQAARGGDKSLVRQEFAASGPMQLPAALTLQLQSQHQRTGFVMFRRGAHQHAQAPRWRGEGLGLGLGGNMMGFDAADADAFLAALTMFVAAGVPSMGGARAAATGDGGGGRAAHQRSEGAAESSWPRQQMPFLHSRSQTAVTQPAERAAPPPPGLVPFLRLRSQPAVARPEEHVAPPPPGQVPFLRLRSQPAVARPEEHLAARAVQPAVAAAPPPAVPHNADHMDPYRHHQQVPQGQQINHQPRTHPVVLQLTSEQSAQRPQPRVAYMVSGQPRTSASQHHPAAPLGLLQHSASAVPAPAPAQPNPGVGSQRMMPTHAALLLHPIHPQS